MSLFWLQCMQEKHDYEELLMEEYLLCLTVMDEAVDDGITSDPIP